jgi:hypothetical protein
VDVVITWSVFEHVSNVPELLAEIRRVLVNDGLLFIQIWPLFFSEHGSHLWPWFDEPFPHLRLEDEDLGAELGFAIVLLVHAVGRERHQLCSARSKPN